jgi:hypothetical protein
VLEGLEREQSGESVPGEQPADVDGPAPLNAATTVEEAGNSTNATMTGAGNAKILRAMAEQPAANREPQYQSSIFALPLNFFLYG